jgi:hypothetical protein
VIDPVTEVARALRQAPETVSDGDIGAALATMLYCTRYPISQRPCWLRIVPDLDRCDRCQIRTEANKRSKLLEDPGDKETNRGT